MQASIDERPAYAPAARRPRLPERVARGWWGALLATDVLALLASCYAAGMPAAVGPAVCVLVCGAIASFGGYATSYCARWRDEIYLAAAAFAAAAIPVWLLLHFVTGLPAWQPPAALLLGFVLVSAMRATLHRLRHVDRRVPYAGAEYVTPQAGWRVGCSPYRGAKRVADVALASVAVLIAAPAMLAAALAILCESGRPILFRQQRVGRSGIPFSIFKFRTMRVDAGSSWARPGDARITPVGAFLRRTSIDELPQFFNVIRGEMSLVGPRPEMEEYARSFRRTLPHYDERHIVLPGITGWAQVQLERNLEPSDEPEVLAYDLFYVEHASPALDALILAKTAAEFLFHRAL